MATNKRRKATSGAALSAWEQFAAVSPEVTRMITCTNAGKFYGLIN